MVEVFWVTLGSPRAAPELSWALLGSPGLLWAAPGCSWWPPALPPETPREQPNHDNQHGPTFPEHSAPQRIF